MKIPNKVGLVVQQSPLVWALPLQALLLLSNLDLLDPWGDEWSTLTTHVSQPLSRVVFIDPMHPPLYHVLLHYWIRLPWTLSPVATMRAMSAVWALLAAVIIYAFWLRREGPRFQAMFLALWVLSPCLLLHARMARSYSMQLALASLAIYAALHWAEQPPKLEAAPRIRWFKQCTSLYALPVWAGCCSRSVGGLCAQETIHIGCVLYVPWVPILGPALGYWIDNSQSYEGGRAGHEPVGLRGTLGPLCQRRLCLLQQERVLGKAVCRTLQRDGRPIVAVDPFGAFAELLLNRLGDSVLGRPPAPHGRRTRRPKPQWSFRSKADLALAPKRYFSVDVCYQTRAGTKRRPRGAAPRVRCLQSAGALGSTIAAWAWATRILLPSV